MTELLYLAAAVVAATAAITAAVIAARSAKSARDANRVSELEDAIEQLHTDRHMLWYYARQLADQIYRMGGTPAAPPEGLFK